MMSSTAKIRRSDLEWCQGHTENQLYNSIHIMEITEVIEKDVARLKKDTAPSDLKKLEQ
jgi:hypothetical protein